MAIKIMDHEKKYNEALERARQFMSEHPTRAEADLMVALFPELHESEDERIREFLIDLLSHGTWKKDWPFSPAECVAYLEKQKEPHYTKRNELFDKCVENCDPKVMKEVSDKVDEMLQKEQKPKEWSERDEEMLEYVIDDVNDAKQLFATKDAIELCDKEIAWLKSLRPQSQGIYQQVVKSLRDMCDRYEKNGMFTDERARDFLGNVRVKCKEAIECAPILDEPNWKPSEEHLNALLAVFNDPNNIGSQTCLLALTDLYEQLKRLK